MAYSSSGYSHSVHHLPKRMGVKEFDDDGPNSEEGEQRLLQKQKLRKSRAEKAEKHSQGASRALPAAKIGMKAGWKAGTAAAPKLAAIPVAGPYLAAAAPFVGATAGALTTGGAAYASPEASTAIEVGDSIANMRSGATKEGKGGKKSSPLARSSAAKDRLRRRT